MSQPIRVGPAHYDCCGGDYRHEPDCRFSKRANKTVLFVVSKETVRRLAEELHRLSGRMTPGGLSSERPGFQERYIYRAEQLILWFQENKSLLMDTPRD